MCGWSMGVVRRRGGAPRRESSACISRTRSAQHSREIGRRGREERERSPSDTTCAANERPSGRRAGARRRRRPRRPRPRRSRSAMTADAIRAAVEPAEPPAQQDEQRRRAGDVARPRSRAGSPRCRSGRRRRRAARSGTRFPSATTVGIQFDCRLKNARFSISIAPLKTSPALNAASAAGDDRRLRRDASAPRWKRMPDDRLGEHRADDRRRDQQERDLAQAVRRPCRGSRAGRRARRAATSDGKSTVAIATENIPCGSM